MVGSGILAMMLSLAGLESAQAALPELGRFQQRCAADGRELWGRSLCAPVVIVDPRSGAYRSSQPAPGPLPSLRANTAFDWVGRKWVMVLAPLPADPAQLSSLLFHEAWHAHQKELGFPSNNVLAGHLEDPLARYLLRLEWAALEKALGASGAEKRRHVAQALAFRRQRLAAFDGAAAAERDQMRHEGLAAYTGVKLSGDARRLAIGELQRGAAKPSLARSFAYVSAPAWGLLLDETSPGWRSKLSGGADIPDLASVPAANIPLADDYGGTRMLGEETLAALQRRVKLAAALAATAEGSALRLPLAQIGMDFDPNRVMTAPDGSSLYEKITLSDRWGKISIEGVPLRIAPDFSAAFAPWPLASPAQLELAPGWRVEELPNGAARLVPAAE